MGIKETIEAWLQPKDLSLILEIEPTPRVAYQLTFPGFSEGGFLDGPSALSVATVEQNQHCYYRHLEMLERNYGGKFLVIINGNETNDGKTRFYVEPAIRGKIGNITWDEFNALYPNASPHTFYINKDRDKGIILAVTS